MSSVVTASHKAPDLTNKGENKIWLKVFFNYMIM